MNCPTPSTPDFHHSLSPAARLILAWDLSDAAHALALSGLQHRHPEWSPSEVHRALAFQFVTNPAGNQLDE